MLLRSTKLANWILPVNERDRWADGPRGAVLLEGHSSLTVDYDVLFVTNLILLTI